MTESIPDGPVPRTPPEGEEGSLISERRYRRILFAAVLSVSFVAIVPLIIATGINYFQYQEAFREEQSRPMVRFAANGKLALEAFFEERTAALRFVSRTRTHEDLTDPATLAETLEDMKASFGGFSDLGRHRSRRDPAFLRRPLRAGGKELPGCTLVPGSPSPGDLRERSLPRVPGFSPLCHRIVSGNRPRTKGSSFGPPSTRSTSIAWSGACLPNPAETCSW